MLTFDTIPQVRVVRHGGRSFTPPPPPRTRERGELHARVHDVLAAAIGMWPITAVLLLGVGLMWFSLLGGAG